MVEDVFAGYPRGWFVVSFSNEIAVGETKPLKYFGRDLAAYRGDDGVVRILDAYCPHLGAHLAIGGTVVGCTIRCPFHAWRFGEGGICVEVPYATRIPHGAKVRSWPVKEVNGVVLMYHDPEGKEPTFDIPAIAEYGSDEWLPWTQNMYKIKTHPREIVENLADKAHFPSVHTTEIDDFGFEVEGYLARQRVKGRSVLKNGGVDTFSSMTEYHGPGYLLMKMDGLMQNYMLVAHTPIDLGSVDLRMGVMLKIVGSRARTEGIVGLYMDNLKHGFEDDIQIWEHKTWRDSPVLCDGDGPIGKLRRWYRQFYTAPAEAAAG